MRSFLVVSLSSLVVGCATPLARATLRMSAERPLDDQSVVAKDLASRHYQKLIVVPPGAPARAGGSELATLVRSALEFAKKHELPPPPPEHPAPALAAADVERELLRSGIALVSPDIAGRAASSAEHASRSERLLVLGKATGADALLEIVGLDWVDVQGRWFLYGSEGNAFDEVDRSHYEVASKASRWSFHAPELRFAARLLDVQSGAVEGEFHVACNTLWSLPAPYTEELDVYRHRMRYVKDSGSYGLDASLEASRASCLARVGKVVADALIGERGKP
ncbi:MAG TPA: hypothetical protein VMB50_13015 [Myxococcales bacterium]|nr:hypothetical protein [Myxococcales bacterium]